METSQDGVTMGRPPKPAHLRRTKRIVVLFTDDEEAAIDAHVRERDYADRSDFARELILGEVGYERQTKRSEEGQG